MSFQETDIPMASE